MAFPALTGTASSLVETTNNGTHAIPYPTVTGGILANDLLVAVISLDLAGVAATFGWPAGWTELADTGDSANQSAGSIAWMRAAGGETGTISVTSTTAERATAAMICIRGAHTTSAPEISAAVKATTANPDPPSLTPTWGAADTLWIAFATADQGTVPTAGPSGYSNFTSRSGTSAGSCAWATREVNATSEDPGAFTMTANESIAWTVAVRPVPSGTPHTVTVNDGLAGTDQTSTANVYSRGIADTIAGTDAPVLAGVYTRAVDDALALTDAATGNLGRDIIVSDTLGLTDVSTSTVGRNATVADQLGLTDALVMTGVFAREIADTLGLTDTQTFARTIVFDEMLAGTDATNLLAAYIWTVNDQLGLTDSATPAGSGALFHTVNDSLGLTDQTVSAAVLARVIADVLALTDTPIMAAATAMALADTMSLTDTALPVSVLARAITDTIDLTDFADPVLAGLNRTLELADTLAAVDEADPVWMPGGPILPVGRFEGEPGAVGFDAGRRLMPTGPYGLATVTELVEGNPDLNGVN